MSADFRALCADLAEQLNAGMSADGTLSLSLHIHVAGTFAEAVLEAYPSELLALLRGLAQLAPEGPQPGKGLTDIALQMLDTIELTELIIPEITSTIRKALEQGRPAPPPAEDGPAVPEGREPASVKQQATDEEVGVLIRELRDAAFDLNGSDPERAMLTRAADLLERLSPQPIPVSERPWEWKGWCDESGRCWWGRSADEFCNPDWHYATYADVEEFCSDAMPHVSLSAHALPLPNGEVE